MDSHLQVPTNPSNAWRKETPGGSERWARSPYPGSARKYFIISADTHLGPPPTLIRDRIAPDYRDRIPRMERDEKGRMQTIIEGRPPMRIVEDALTGEDQYRAKAGSSAGFDSDSNDLAKRMADLDLDGVDAELAFPNGPVLAAFWTTDPGLMQAQFRIYNDWAEELTRNHRRRMNVAACIATGDVDSAIQELQRVATQGYRVITLPCKPVFGSADPKQLNYNQPAFDPFWAAIEEADLTITFHVSTGADPRGATGPGGAVINYAVHALSPTAEPVANLCTSGVLDRFPKLRFSIVEAGIGWVPWLLEAMDEGYRKHHMWAFPKLKHGLPSDYFRAHGGATFGEDRPGITLVEPLGLQDNFFWANDYPHHEGSFPYSAQAIERQMGNLKEETRVKLLGLNAARMFRFDVPDWLAVARV
jgi:predicted TIM-barrel fold metal-dependent hydrolase